MLFGSLNALPARDLSVSPLVVLGSTGFTGGRSTTSPGLRSSTAAPSCSFVGLDPHAASVPVIIATIRSFFIAWLLVVTGLSFRQRAPCGLAHVAGIRGESLLHPAITRNRGQYTTPPHHGCVEDHPAVRREARRLVHRSIREYLHLPRVDI